MESTLKNVYINKLQIPKFHGHMRLELCGCRETEVIEHENNMTSAFEKLLSPEGLWMNPGRIYETLSPTIEVALGGILLTDKTLDDIVVPGGTEVTACAAYGVANSDEALTQGSYNTKESVLDLATKKMTYVYDWNTSQGNGTIAAAALTHKNMGLCGYGDAGLSLSTSAAGGGINIDNNIYNIQYAISGKETFYVDGEIEIDGSWSNNVMTIYKYDSNYKTVNPIGQKKGENRRSLDYVTYEKKEINMESYYLFATTCNDGVYMYIAGPGTVNINEKAYVKRINIASLEAEEIEITNKTESRWSLNMGMDVYDEKIYIMSTDKDEMYEINLKNPEDINTYTIKRYSNYMNKIANIGSGKIFINNGGNIGVFDCINKTFKNTKLSIMDSQYRVINRSFKPVYYYNGYNVMGYSAFYLATNCNLDKEVVKTADKTMKVTYTIQQE